MKLLLNKSIVHNHIIIFTELIWVLMQTLSNPQNDLRSLYKYIVICEHESKEIDCTEIHLNIFTWVRAAKLGLIKILLKSMKRI